MFTRDLITVGTSAGGVEALQLLARGLPKDLPAAVLIVIHTSPHSPHLLPEILSKVTPVEVADVVDGARIEPGKLYIAPPDHHLLVKGSRLRLSKGPKENRSRPAIDPLFRTAAAAYGPRVVGVILTGRLDDGTVGLWEVKECGGTTIVQDPSEALYPSMPESALRHVGADYTLPLSEIAPLLVRLSREPVKIPKPFSISRLNEIESKFAQMEATNMQDMDAIGSRAGISCPECHGPMWKIRSEILPRYRCHVGHAYTAQTMAEEQKGVQETHLWQALRLMKERVSLLFEMRCDAEKDRSEGGVSACDAKIRHLQKNIARLQEMLQEEEPPW